MVKNYIFGHDLRYSECLSTDGGDTVYAVYGEDPNCDMGGSHHTPFLGNVEGTFIEVLEYAANNFPRFYEWGGGGHIVPVKDLKESVTPIIVNKKKKLKIERRKKLTKLMKISIGSLIENIDSMTKVEIKNSLLELKKIF